MTCVECGLTASDAMLDHAVRQLLRELRFSATVASRRTMLNRQPKRLTDQKECR